MNPSIDRMEGEIDAIDTRINQMWAAIKADLARKEWLRIQIMKEQGMKV